MSSAAYQLSKCFDTIRRSHNRRTENSPSTSWWRKPSLPPQLSKAIRGLHDSFHRCRLRASLPNKGSTAAGISSVATRSLRSRSEERAMARVYCRHGTGKGLHSRSVFCVCDQAGREVGGGVAHVLQVLLGIEDC